VVLPGVFNPAVFRSGQYFADFLSEMKLYRHGMSVLDLGTGSGVLAVIAAIRSCRVTAIDIEKQPVACAQANAALSGVEVRVLQGDLFAPVRGERFDLVLFNPPWYRGVPKSSADRAWRSPDIFERFASNLPNMLNPKGQALIILSSHGDPRGMLSALADNGLQIQRLTWGFFGCETMAIYSAQTR
jgi:HemK-related putative methylase